MLLTDAELNSDKRDEVGNYGHDISWFTSRHYLGIM